MGYSNSFVNTLKTAAICVLATTLTDSFAQLENVTSQFDVNLYGYIKLDASYDTQRTTAGNLMFFVLPESADGQDDEFNMTARETRLGFNIRVPDMRGTRISGVAETDFYGGASENSPNLRLRLAYFDLERDDWSLRAGQDWETFITILPRIVNFSYLADSGALGLRRPQIRLTRNMSMNDETLLIAKLAAARTIGSDIDGGGQDDGAAAGYPTIQGNLALETRGIANRRLIVSLSGHAGTERVSSYLDVTDPDSPVIVKEKDFDTWSLIGSLAMPLSAKLLLQGTIWQGENLNAYFGGIGQGINRQRQTGIRAGGGWAQLVFDPTPTVNLNFGYGLDKPDSDDLESSQRSKNDVWFGNVFYRLNTALTLAAEYSNMTTSYRDGDDAVNNRFHGSLIFRF